MRFFIAPNLNQELYLGFDFWMKFGIYPTVNEVSKEFNVNDPSNKNILSKEQEEALKEVINQIPSFNEKGLGKTSLITHVIDVGASFPVKQRLYPISPAVQADLYTELARMLALKLIEISHSSWCSPVTLVKKPNGKYPVDPCISSLLCPLVCVMPLKLCADSWIR